MEVIMSFKVVRTLPTPEEIKRDLPIPEELALLKEKRDREIAQVIRGESKKFLVIVSL